MDAFLGTFYSEGTLDTSRALLVAAAVGVAFGFFLERSGFGSSRKLVSIFYLKDFAVFKVMFSAIVVAMLGARALSTAGLVDLTQWYQLETFLWPQIAGGLIFGVGFVMGGWCPGTALVGAASGRGDSLVFLGGAGLGSLIYALAFPALEDFSVSGAQGVSTLSGTFGLSPGLTALLVVVLAIGAFVGSNKLVAWKARQTA
ncbi:MAG: YeeE/YedE thiosulfate transporter family protein [Myxococcota bacterium]